MLRMKAGSLSSSTMKAASESVSGRSRSRAVVRTGGTTQDSRQPRHQPVGVQVPALEAGEAEDNADGEKDRGNPEQPPLAGERGDAEQRDRDREPGVGQI